MIQLSGAGKRFGPKFLFENLDWLITPQDRVGLVGANGSGKSTLLKVLAGPESLDYGAITRARGITAGYLAQDGLQLAGRTVFDECLSVFDDLHQMQREMEELAHRMGELDPAGGEYAQIADRFQRLEGAIRARDGYAIEAQVGTVLAGLGFRKEDWPRRTEEFSGGWQMRIALAKLLLEKPNLLLLDEPTNHLDLETRNWLEDYLRDYPYAYVLVSHDRYFLDVTVKRRRRSGTAGAFLQRQLREVSAAEAAAQGIAGVGLPQPARAHRAAGGVHQPLPLPGDQGQAGAEPHQGTGAHGAHRGSAGREDHPLHFSAAHASGRMVAEFTDVAKSYGEKEVFADVSFIIERGDRIALVGVNGAGKSTLIKLLAGRSGLRRPMSRGAQRGGGLLRAGPVQGAGSGGAHARRPRRVAPQKTQPELRTLLGCFLFSDDDVFKRIGVLSGGERNRYALARMLLQPSNFLLLDEPTNHLDLRAKDVLLEALEKFTGTVVFVSHDRYFIDKLATRVFEVGEGARAVFPGNYEDYLWRKQQLANAAAAAGDGPAKNAAPESNGSRRGRARLQGGGQEAGQSHQDAPDDRALPGTGRGHCAHGGRDRRGGAGIDRVRQRGRDAAYCRIACRQARRTGDAGDGVV